MNDQSLHKKPEVILYSLGGLPSNLLLPHSENKAPPLYGLVGLHNREARKAKVKRLRKAWRSVKNDSDDDVLTRFFKEQKSRCATFWEKKDNFKDCHEPIIDYYDVFGPSILHSLMAKYRPDAFAEIFSDELRANLTEANIPLNLIIDSLKKGQPDFDISKLGFLRLWESLSSDLENWAQFPYEYQCDIANAIFALSSAVDASLFMEYAVGACPELREFYEGLEDPDAEEILKGVMAKNVSGEGTAEGEVWENLVCELGSLADQMKTDGPSAPLVASLKALVERFDLVPLPNPIDMASFLERLNKVFGPYEHGDQASSFSVILEDIHQVLARWKFLAYAADAQHLKELYDDLDRCDDESRELRGLYVEAAQALSDAIRMCEETQRSLGSASFSKKQELRNELKVKEAARDQIDDQVNARLSCLFSSLNFQGAPFEHDRDWKADLAALEGVKHEPVLISESGSAKCQESNLIVDEQNSTDMADEDTLTVAESTLVATIEELPVAEDAHDDFERPKQDVPLLSPAISANLSMEIGEERSEQNSPSSISSSDHLPAVVPSIVSERFWSLVEAGEYGLAYNLISASKEPNGLPSLNAVRLLVLGTELAFPQGAISRGLEESISAFDVAEEFRRLQPSDKLAINLTLVAATVRSGLLAPGTGANGILQDELSLGSGWSALHELAQVVAKTAHQIHGAILGPDAFRQGVAHKPLEAERAMLREKVENWLDANMRCRLSFQPATHVWQKWLNKDGFVYQLLLPILDQSTSMSADWRDLLGKLADPDNVEATIQETDRNIRGPRFGNIDYRALDRLQRLVAEAVAMVREWMSIEDCQPKTDYVDRNIKDLDRRLEELRDRVFTELSVGMQKDELAQRAAATCLEREIKKLYQLFSTDSFVHDERTVQQALNDDLLLLPSIHLDSAFLPGNTAEELLAALLSHKSGSTPLLDGIARKADEGDYAAVQRLLDRSSKGADPVRTDVVERYRNRLSEARDALKSLHADTLKKLESEFRSGLVGDDERERMISNLTDIDARMKDVTRIDVARQQLSLISARVAECSALRLKEVQQRFSQLNLANDDSRYSVIARLLEKGDALAAEEYIDHVARGETTPSSDQADDPLPGLPSFLRTLTGIIPINELDAALRQGVDFGGLPLSELSEPIRTDAVAILGYWNALKRLKRTNAEPTFDAAVFSNLLSAIGLRIASSSDISLNARSVSRMDITVKAVALADRRVCPVPEFGSEAKGCYRVICVYPKTQELEPTEITPPQRGSATATIVLFLGQLSRDGRQKLLRQNLQARRAWIVIDELVLIHLALEAQGRLRSMFAATLPYTVTDPYRIKQSGIVPPEMFFGRNAEREAIIAPHGASFVYGGRQLGKTVLLKEIERLLHDPNNGSIVQWVDLPGHGVGRSCRPESIWTILVRELRRYGVVSMDWPDFRPADQKHVAKVTEDIRNWLEQNPNGRILLLLDEADEFLKEEAAEDYPVTRQLKALMERTGGRFKTVFVGLHNVLRSTRAANNPLVHLGSVEIGPLYAHGESRAAFEMVRRPFLALGYVFADDSLIMRVLAACNYYPNLINLFCRKLLERLRNRADAPSTDPAKGPHIVTEKFVAETYETTALRDDIRHYFLLTLELDTRYELIGNWLALEYLQKNMSSADGVASLDIRTAARALWPDGFRGTTDQEFDALLMEMVGLGVLRRINGNHFTFRNPNVLQLMGGVAEIDERLTKISVDGELKPGFDAVTFRGPMAASVRDPQRSPLTIAQETQICTSENGVNVICGAVLNGLADVQRALTNRHAVSQVSSSSALTPEQAVKDLDAMRSKPKPGINILVINENKPWTHEWITKLTENLASRVSTSSFVRVIFEASPLILWNMAKANTLNQLDAQKLIALKPWADPYLWIWLEDMNLSPQKELRKAILEATDGRPGLLLQLHSDFDGAKLHERVDTFKTQLFSKDRANAVLGGLGVINEDAQKGLSVIKELSGETFSVFEEFWSDMGPSCITVPSFIRWAELLSLVRPVGHDRWEVEPFVAKLLDCIS